MKRIISVILTFCLIMLCACSAGESGGISDASPQEAGSAAEDSAVMSEEISEEMSEETEESSSKAVKDLSSLPELSEEDDDQPYPIGVASREESGVYADGKFVYCAFGDSIAAGYGLKDPRHKCYGALFAAMAGDCEFRNFAVSGDKTGDMLRVMKSADYSDADLITVSIGANNVLYPASSAVLSLFNKYGTDIFSEYAKTLIGLGDKERVKAFFTELAESLDETTLRARVAEGLKVAKKELPLILDGLHEQAPHAVIFIQTVYNPYKGMRVSLPGIFEMELSKLTEEFVTELNALIIRAAEVCGCEVLDVYTEFDKSETRLVNASATPTATALFEIDPHPNAKGHECIAKMLKRSWDAIMEKANEE